MNVCLCVSPYLHTLPQYVINFVKVNIGKVNLQ